MFPPIEQLSHAIIITGNRIKNLELFKEFLTNNSIEIQANPDISIFNDEQLLMDDAMQLVATLTSQKVSEKRFCIISCDRIAVDVQNRLLKTIEEPQDGTYIIVIVPNADRLLPTVLSRCQVISGDYERGDSRLDVSEFLKKNIADRFQFIESWTKNKKDEDNVSKTEVIHFIDALEKNLWQKGNQNEQLFTDIRKVREYAHIRGSSHRILLDFLAMIAPKK